MSRIRKASLIVLPILFLLFCLLVGGAHAQQAPPKKNVLMLHGLWRIRTWEIPFNSALHDTFLADKAMSVGITHVYLGLKDFPDGIYPQHHIDDLRDRVESNPVDLVISVLPGADRFLLDHGQALFPDIPKIFALPGSREIKKINDSKNAVIIPSMAENSAKKTIEGIFSLLPDTKHLVVVSGDDILDRNYIEVAKRVIASAKRTATVSYLVGVPLDALLKQVSNLGPDTAIFITTYGKDINGNKQTTNDVGVHLARSANAPVFSVFGSLVGSGIVGGNIANAESYAENTAEVGLQLLQGKPPAAVSPTQPITVDVFDWRALMRWNIPEDRLPPGSRMLYKTETFWEAQKARIVVVLGIICMETILIYALFIALRRGQQAKQALQQSEERYRTLHDNVPVGVYRASDSGQLESFNPAVVKMFGYDATEDLSSYPGTVFYKEPANREVVLNQLKMDGRITDYEAEFKRKDGSSFWGSLNATRVTDADGNLLFIDGVVQDITERKRVEAKLFQEQAFTEAILSSLPGAFYVYDENLRLIRWNRNQEAVSGYTAEEAYGKLPTDWFVGEDQKIISQVVEQVMVDGSATAEADFTNKDGTKVPFFFTGNRLTIDNKNYLLGLGIDISARKQIEEDLQNSERRLADIIDFLPDATLVIDTDGKVVAWNQAIEKLTGVKAYEMLGKGNYEYALPFYGVRRPMMIDLALDWDDEIAKTYAYTKKKDGILVSETIDPPFRPPPSLFWNSARVLTDARGEVIGAIEVIRDITHRMLAERALQASEKRYRSIVEDQTELITRWRPDGTITFANKAYYDYFGAVDDKCVGSNCFPRIHQADRNAVRKKIASLTPSNPVSSDEHRVTLSDGKIAWNQMVDRAFFDDGGQLIELQSVGRDVTQRKQAENKLQKSEAKLRGIFNQTFQLMGLLSTDGTLLEANRTALEFAKVDAAAVIGKPFWETAWLKHSAEEQEKAREAVEKAAAGEFVRYEATNSDSTGTIHTVDFSLKPVLDADGNVIYLNPEARDITARKRMEETLRASEKRFRTLVANIPGAVYRCDNDPQWTMRFLSDAIAGISGYPASDFIENRVRSYTSVIHPDDRDMVDKAVGEGIAGAEPFSIEYRIRDAQGEVKWVHELGMGILGADGEVIHFDGAIFDITERKQAEDEMTRLRHQLKNIIDSMPSSIMTVTPGGTVTQWNTQAEKMTGIPTESALGRYLPDVFPQLTAAFDSVQDTIASGTPHIDTKVPQSVDQGRRYQDITVYPLIANSMGGAVIRVDDVTERVRMEEMVIQSEKMLSVGGLAAGMAHEINNPLAGIMQNVDLVLRRLTEDLPANLKAAAACATDMTTIKAYIEKRDIPVYMGDVHEAGARASEIVKNMLSFARMGAGRAMHHDLSELLDRTVKMAASDYDLKKKYDFRTIEILREYDPGVPKVLCEGSKIQQVFMNILKNGAQAMHETAAGSANLAKRSRFILRISKADEGVCVKIQDNGPGMEDATRKKIFEPFFSTKSAGVGTGLGLSVSYFIVKENHGGSMTVESRPGEGTTFIITLPIKWKWD